MTSPSSSSETASIAKSLPDVPAFDFHFNPTTDAFHPQNVQNDPFCQPPVEATVGFSQDHGVLLNQHFDMQNAFFPSIGYTVNSEQAVSDANPEASLETLKVGLSMVLDSIWQLKTDYQERIDRVER